MTLQSSNVFDIFEVLNCWGQNIIDKYEDGLFRTQLDALSNDMNKLAYSQICWDQIPTPNNIRGKK